MSDKEWLLKEAELVARGVEHNEAVGVTIVWRATEHSFEFRAREGTMQQDGKTVCYMYMPAGASEMTEDFDTAERFVDGWVKWDGCSHLNFGDKDSDGYMHVCGGRSYWSLCETLRRVQELAVKHVPKLDRSCAEMPFVPHALAAAEIWRSLGERVDGDPK